MTGNLGRATGEALPFAVAIMVGPLPIIAVVLLLTTPRARASSLSFVLGWIAGLGALGALVLALAGPADPTDGGRPATWVNWLRLTLGLLLLVVAIRQWRSRPAPEQEALMPRWMGALSECTPAKAAGLALVLASVNPKNLIFGVGGATAVAQTGIPGSEQALAWTIFTVIASVGVVAPVAVFFVLGARAAAVLEQLRIWMARNSTAIMAVLCLVIGAQQVGDAISGFAA